MEPVTSPSKRQLSKSNKRSHRRRKGRLRTQSESAVWARASLRMAISDFGMSDHARISHTNSMERSNGSVASEEGQVVEEERHSLPCLDAEDLEDEMQRYASMVDRKRTKSTSAMIGGWSQQGQISRRASEMLEDAKLALHGQEKNLYKASARRLSAAQDPVLNTLGDRLAQNAAAVAADKLNEEQDVGTEKEVSLEELVGNGAGDVQEHDVEESSGTPKLSVDDQGMENHVRPESATLYHEAVKWEGVLSKRSEWLRRLEKHYYVMEGKFLRRFASKEAYIASRDEPLVREPERPRRHSSASNTVSHLYIIAGVKDSTTRTHGFTFITEDKRTLQLQAPTAVEKVIWMRLALEAIVAIPNLPVTPLDMEEFYAMLVVLYTAYKGNWRTDGDMAVTLPPPSEQVFTRFFRLLDKDVIFCSNYPPSVPFHGSYRGHAGVIRFIHEFSRHTLWTNFKIGGLSIEGSIAVASGKEELENKYDGRKFIQNWAHKFTFYSNGRLARFEINGDVVAASAVFKVPGAATTLKLPHEFNEVDAEHGKRGSIVVRVMQANNLKLGTSAKKSVKEPSVAVTLFHRDKPMPKLEQPTTSSGLGGLSIPSMPSLSRRFSSGRNMFSSSSSSGSSHMSNEPTAAKIPENATGPPRDSQQASYNASNPVWNKMILVPFGNVIGTCSLLVEVMEFAKGPTHEQRIGYVCVNVAKYIMSARRYQTPQSEEEELAADSRWYTLNNLKGEYCGKVQLGITCRMASEDDDLADSEMPRLKKSQSVIIDHSRTPSSKMLQWDLQESRRITTDHAQSTRSNSARSSNSYRSEDFVNDQRRHGWANVKLSPENLARTKSDGDVDKEQPSRTRASTNASNSIVCKENKNMHTFIVCGAPFTIPRYYQLIKVCGRGAYGIVIAATNTLTGGNVAIKKVIDCIWHPHQLKQILREVRLIRHMHHENVLNLMDLIPPTSYEDFRDVYMTVDLMEMDLHRIIYSKEVLLDDHIRYFLYQMLSGLNHMHKAGVLHRDLKPSNLLINSDCLLKICDLGLARSKDDEDAGMTEYVVTRWYRAPELLLGSAYGEGVDLWAAGCIFAEMLGRKPLFPGETYVHQLQLIMNVLGVPEEHSFKENPLANKLKGRQLLSRTQASAGMDLATLFPNANPEALDLLCKMLVFDAEKRISVQDALQHPYLAAYYDEEKENLPVEKFKSFDLDGLDETDLKELMFKEICHFHPEEMEKRARYQAENPNSQEKLPPGWVKRESRSIPGKFYYSNPKRGISTWIKEEMD